MLEFHIDSLFANSGYLEYNILYFERYIYQD